MSKKFHEIIMNDDLRVVIASSRPKKFKIGACMIMKYQKSGYSHVLIIVNDIVFQASHGFVNAFHISEFEKENILIDQIEIKKEECDFEYMLSMLGRRYGFIQLLKIAMRHIAISKLRIINSFKHKDNGNRLLICSEYVGKFLRLSWVNDLTDPEDIISHLIKIKKK